MLDRQEIRKRLAGWNTQDLEFLLVGAAEDVEIAVIPKLPFSSARRNPSTPYSGGSALRHLERILSEE